MKLVRSAARFLLGASVILAPTGLGAQQPGRSPGAMVLDYDGPPASCEAFSESISLSGLVTITSATGVPAGPGEAAPGQAAPVLPEHCLVEGVINPRTGFGGVEYGIGFEIRLPSDWNGRFLLQGGGGLNGSVRPAIGPVAAGSTPALARGFAVISHDSGHQGAGFDRSFFDDQRAALDFAESSVPTVATTGKMLTQLYYGEEPHHSYMTGCSTGGREGMLASQRYPELFDGIIIGAPAMRPGYSNLGIEWAQMLLNRTLPAGEAGPAGFSADERATVLGSLLQQCDALDGINDGMIADVAACNAQFDPYAMQCQAGSDGEGCLAPDRVNALRQLMAGPRDATGRPIYVPIPWDTGVVYDGPGLPGFLPVGQPSPFGPATTARELDIDARVHDIRWDAAGRLTDTPYWTNLSTYLGRGSKLMYFHGVSDPWFSAFDTLDYFNRARSANGAETWDDAARFYMVPGMLHCRGGNAFDNFDMLGPLVDWVESEEAPAAIPARRSTGGDDTMPLCPWPSSAHYTGGPQLVESSYECRMPES
ncbi:DUF6351 family protein [Aurantiacibacter gilvus]|uniref:DUF6351 family protein n=1 Tax=Aurantiacibacter gilvus TaxID=3139141 RepID=A0ABU9IHW2_9SPHN